ncbi:hypothetical protein CKO11_00330 [Rhodobacter sp. TJ_12]|uniref:beta strand repeat-containing protein n=1 Tax=Rhodobacter sp. TJ_12 TaxID=2029399 RepID=UPI001CC077C2|nr:Ig-like domain-containing protein [Rhodobacter sp. TJ_12]MBZ4020905.1 hypothetical protein [Rhodobacter sp. TJ_12]
MRDGDDLQIALVDGRVITLSGYFDADAKLYISADGELTQVTLEDGGDGVIYAGYGQVEVIGKWSPNDQLAFLDGDDILAPAGDDATGMAMFAPMAGLGGLGVAGAGLVGLGVLNPNGGGGTGGGGASAIIPTVDNPDADYTLTTNTEDPAAIVSGTGEPGSTVVVVLGDQSLETTVDDDGLWSVTFEGDSFPSDGDMTSTVFVTAPDTTLYELDGPDFLIDMTPPDVALASGVQSTGDIENLAEYQDGITLTGTGEAGAEILVTVAGETQTTTVGTDGTWSVTFTTSQLPPGEYSEAVEVTATDPLGNKTTINDTLVVDTVPNDIVIDAVAGDDVVNAIEMSVGTLVSGTGTPGALLSVTMEGVTHDTTVAEDGTWSVIYTPGEMTGGTYDTTVTVTSTDAAGNPSSATHDVHIDTEAAVAFGSGAITADGVVNAAEAASGFTLSGTSEAGTTAIEVQLGGVSYDVTPAADGSWSVNVSGAGLGTGTHTATVTAVDANGNSATDSRDITFDVDAAVAFDAGNVTSDNVVNVAEAASGFTLSGTSEAGTTAIELQLGGVSYDVTPAADGSWSVDVSGAGLSTGTHTATVTAVDAYGNSATDSRDITFDVDAAVAFDAGNVTSDNVVNAREAAGGFTLSGTSEAGSTSVTVELGGVNYTTTPAANGAWNLVVSGTALTTGSYVATVTATDAYGNTATDTRSITFDTDTSVAVSPGQAGGDDVLSGAERGAGLVLTGTAEPGATVQVEFESGTRVVTADARGNWSASFAAGEIRTGDYTSTATVTATDTAGNVATTTHDITVDTQVQNLTHTTPTPNALLADNIVNAAEGASGLLVTGTVEPGSDVTVQLASGSIVTATVLADGTWTATIPAGELPVAETDNVPLTVWATDAYGNTISQSSTVDFDPLVRDLNPNATVTGDNLVNAQEGADGFQIAGTVEAGSQITVALASGASQTVTAGATGNWSVTFDSDDLSGTSGTMGYEVTAVDPAGNTDTATGSFTYDVEAPDSPDIIAFTRNAGALLGLRTDLGEDTYDIAAVSAAGTVSDVSNTATLNTYGGYGSYDFNTAVPNGSYLVVTDTDGAGNDASTLLVVDNTSAVTVDLSRSGLGEFDLGMIDLNFAPQADLTITESQLMELTGPDHTLMIQGDSLDDVTALGAQDTNADTVVGGNTYSIYTLGNDGGTLIIDDQIHLQTT